MMPFTVNVPVITLRVLAAVSVNPRLGSKETDAVTCNSPPPKVIAFAVKVDGTAPKLLSEDMANALPVIFVPPV